MEAKTIIEGLKTKVQRDWKIMEHNLEEDMVAMWDEYSKLCDEGTKAFQKKNKLSDDEMLEWENFDGKLADRWEDIFSKAQKELESKPRYKYWNLEIEHEEMMIKIIYWSGWYWYRYEDGDWDFEIIVEIENALKEATGEASIPPKPKGVGYP